MGFCIAKRELPEIIMKGNIVALALFCLYTCSCNPKMSNSKDSKKSFSWQGHRGSRGLMPENTIPAMKKAIDVGANTMEMDVVISADNKVVVSHDTYFNELFTTAPDGKYLTKKEANDILLYRLAYDSISKYDVGLKPHPDFPRQEKLKVAKPLLSELLDACEAYAKEKGVVVSYNIEIKSNERYDGIRHPDTKTFAELVISVVREKNIQDRLTIQSFDVRPLQYLHQHHRDIALSYLVDRNAGTLQQQLDKLGFIPAVYSPVYLVVTAELVQQAHQKGMKVIPWTMNTADDLKKMVDLGVDGVISDYPDLFNQLR
jgi:glycerophosphoryl diester phosphodiesterase